MLFVINSRHSHGSLSMRSRLNSLVLLLVLLTLAVVPARADQKQERKVRSARWVAEELFDQPDRRLPQPLLEQTRCVAIFPDVPRARRRCCQLP
jgi:hypothetical protein